VISNIDNELPGRKQGGIFKSIERPKGRGIKPYYEFNESLCPAHINMIEKPPSTGKATPVRKSEARLAR
jgi:hypothetical protein